MMKALEALFWDFLSLMMKALGALFWLFLSLICFGVAFSDDHSLVPSLIHGALFPLEVLHLMWAAATGELGPRVLSLTWGIGLLLAAIMCTLGGQPYRVTEKRAESQNNVRLQQNKPQTYSDEEISRQKDAAAKEAAREQNERAENRRRIDATIEAAARQNERFREQNKPQTTQTYSDEEIRRRMDAAVAAARQGKGLTPDSAASGRRPK